MLTDATLRNLKPKDKGYKVSDRDGLYVYVLTSSTVSFRYNYAINGRQETLVLGRYGPGGLKLGEVERYMMAESTRDMRRSVYERDLKKPYEKLKPDEITEKNCAGFVIASWHAERRLRRSRRAKSSYSCFDTPASEDKRWRIQPTRFAPARLHDSSRGNAR